MKYLTEQELVRLTTQEYRDYMTALQNNEVDFRSDSDSDSDNCDHNSEELHINSPEFLKNT